jgi:heme oxygenase (mycobilin-producing)
MIVDSEARVDSVEPNGACDARAGFVALSRFVIANGMTDEVKRAFAERPHLVDEAPGYLRMDVLSPLECPEEIWLVTYWSDEQSFRAWHHSHLYHESHGRIPKGLKLVPRSAELRYFEHVSS